LRLRFKPLRLPSYTDTIRQCARTTAQTATLGVVSNTADPRHNLGFSLFATRLSA
jgi:hypothetical protein